jgi:hypothetical protein
MSYHGIEAFRPRLPDPPDYLESEFRRLEQFVKQRECIHPEVVEITSVDSARQLLCVLCGAKSLQRDSRPAR